MSFHGSPFTSSDGSLSLSAYSVRVYLQQRYLQALVFHHLASGLTVPLHLLAPIWNGVLSSSASANAEIHNRLHRVIRSSSQKFDHRTVMDPEPGRCRRTDGKKWRCKRDVVPSLRYCEQHLHRGTQRSRKYVESSNSIAELDTSTAIKSENTLDGSKSFLLPVSANLQLTTPSSLDSDNDPATITSSADGNSRNYHHVYINNDSCATPTTFYTCNSSKESDDNANGIFTTATATTAATSNRASTKSSFSRNNSNYNRNNGNFVAPGFGFSPRSVLQGGTSSGFEPCIETELRRCSLTDGKNWRCKREVIPEKKYCLLHIQSAGYTGSRSDLGSCIESERQRCGRTDGKRWRCSRDVIPERKYCDQHMHRGAKKPFVASETVTVAAAPPALTIPKNFDTRLNLNTSLSMSIPARPPVINSEEDVSVSSSSSDATTISDET
ncbi:hypothetical protein RJ639_031742 [Escallonia herrerae]|uniref:Growth-regulating factor n=1 Tax=Escallonia herrerae TaxID=1293975 RepID=A0AA88XDI2_9ASTE|nr:hypothetical protein RJ639_031742 [Escallonia herrerae]